MQSGQKSEIVSCSDFATTVQVIWASRVFGRSAEQAEQALGSLLNIPICFSAAFWAVSSDKFLRLGLFFFFLLRLTCLACFFVPDILFLVNLSAKEGGSDEQSRGEGRKKNSKTVYQVLCEVLHFYIPVEPKPPAWRSKLASLS